MDTYMASANGEYIKEYLFVLRHEGEAVTVFMIADAVNHTESDVTRALSYWKKLGVLETSVDKVPVDGPDVDKWPAAAQTACAGGMITESMESPLNGAFPEACVAVQSSYDYVERPVKGSGTGTAAYGEAA
ncbi:DNA replication protein DnaD, partial [Anaerotignum faecicola]|nr:DNA replication protein DnaD [Anaerotignum faecicola]